MSPVLVGLIGLAVMLVLMAARIPIAFCFGLAGFAGSIYFVGLKGASVSLALYAWSQTVHYTLMSLPLFVLMGYFIGISGLGKELFEMFHKWIGHIRGGLAVATVGACAAFAACSGSSMAGVATMGTICYPEMRKFGYDKKLAAGSVSTAGTLAILIPPSTLFIIYASMTEVSIGKLFIAGIFPGLMLAGMLALMIYVRCAANPKLAPLAPSFTWRERLNSLSSGGVVAMIFFIIMGGIYFGWFTAIEASAVGAFMSCLYALARGKLKWPVFTSVLKETGRVTCMIFLIVIMATYFGYFLGLSRLPMAIADFLTGLPFERHILMALILAVYIPLGCVMEVLAMLLLTIPIFFPAIKALGFDPIWFGIMVTMMSELAQITPPVGLAVFVMKSVASDASIEEIFSGIFPFVLTIIVAMAIIFIFPQVTLYLPGIMK